MIIFLLGALLLFAAVQRPGRVVPPMIRMAAVVVPAGLITAYLAVPLVMYRAYLNDSPYLQAWKKESFGASEILSRLFGGSLVDSGRIPVMTILLVLGIAWALYCRSGPAKAALALFVTYLAIYFGRVTWGALAEVAPLHEALVPVRFAAAVHMSAILLVGLGGEWIWQQCKRLPRYWASVAAGAIILALMIPALIERGRDYWHDAQSMRSAQQALAADADAASIIETLKTLPPGRTYAGLRTNWGNQMTWGYLHFWDLLTFNQIPEVSPPYQGLSLNSDLIWHFDDNNAAHYKIFNVRYVVAPSSLLLTTFYTPIKKTPRYTLYETPGGGYAQFGKILDWKIADSQSSLFDQNRAWLLSHDPSDGRFIRWSYLGSDPGPGINPYDMSGTVVSEKVSPGRIEEIVRSTNPATLVFKMTYHPDWHVQIDLHDAPTFMVSPSFIGVTLPAGTHLVTAVYKSNRLKDFLLLVSAATVILIVMFGGALSARLEDLIQKIQYPRQGDKAGTSGERRLKESAEAAGADRSTA